MFVLPQTCIHVFLRNMFSKAGSMFLKFQFEPEMFLINFGLKMATYSVHSFFIVFVFSNFK